MERPTHDWELVGDRFYRKTQLYTSIFDPDLELENYKVAGAPYGGAVALYRDEDKFFAYRGSQATKAAIDIYSCAGRLIRSISWDKGSIVAVGWSEDERLLVVTNDGTVRSYVDLQDDFTPFTLGHGAEEHGVVACKFWSTGFVALLGNNNLVAVTRYDEPRPQALAPAPNGEILSWTVIPPEYASSRSVEVLLAVDKTVYVVDAVDTEDRGLQAGPFRHICTSPNGKLIALYTDDGKIWVISSDFQEARSEYDSKARTPPKDVEWCGNNAVVFAWDDEINVVGPNGKATKLPEYNSFVHLLPDIDGIRILSTNVCEFLQMVPDQTQEVFSVGSNAPGAVLLDAVQQLENRSPKADENIQLIRDRLDEAVDTCVKAAGHEYSIHRQKQLLKAASFGKSVLDLYNSDDFVDTTEILRVLNAVRFFEIGLPLSYDQYVRLTPERLIQRLVNRQEYLLALKISEFLHLPVDKIYVSWARQKVRSSTTDEDRICEEIVRKLGGKRGISFEEVARAAYYDGRKKLATELLEHEPRAGKQVPLLMSIGEESIALDKAIESGDTDLIDYVLRTLKSSLPAASFFRTINGRPVAIAIFESTAFDEDQQLLRDFYYQDDREIDGSNLILSEALEAGDTNQCIDRLKMAARAVRDGKENAPKASALEAAQKLLRFQETFEKELSDKYVGLSVNETLVKLIERGHVKRSQKIQTEFKIGEKTFSWVRLRALVSKRDWTQLEELGNAKKSAIGWEPYFNEVLGAGNPNLAASFVDKCTALTTGERVEMFLKCGMEEEARQEAFRAKDVRVLEDLMARTSGAAQNDIKNMITQLTRKK